MLLLCPASKPRSRRVKKSSSTGNGNSLDANLDRAIEAMSHLREDLRREGFTDLAHNLDKTLVKCLKLYAERDSDAGDGPDHSNGSGGVSD
jgi:hypothetical protein